MCFKITGARIPSKLLASTMPKTVRLIFQQRQFPRRFPLQCCFSYSRYTHDIYKITKLTMRNLSVKFNQYQIFSNQVCIFLSLSLSSTRSSGTRTVYPHLEDAWQRPRNVSWYKVGHWTEPPIDHSILPNFEPNHGNWLQGSPFYWKNKNKWSCLKVYESFE